MRYWYDTEFIEDGKTIDLISIGIVAEDGREYYAISTAFNSKKASDWVKENVLVYLPKRDINPAEALLSEIEARRAWKSRGEIKADVLAFCDPEKYGKPEFWGYYSAYDHVALCQLFGAMIELPRGYYRCETCGNRLDKLPDPESKVACQGGYKKIPGWPMYTNDIKQLCDSMDNPKLPGQGKGEHHALADARWNKLAWEFLQNYSKEQK